MMLTQRSQARKCLLKSKTEVYILYKRVWSDQRTGSRNRGGRALQVKRLQNIFHRKARVIKDQWIFKISCVISVFTWTAFHGIVETVIVGRLFDMSCQLWLGGQLGVMIFWGQCYKTFSPWHSWFSLDSRLLTENRLVDTSTLGQNF
jgi:hypothetical protein